VHLSVYDYVLITGLNEVLGSGRTSEPGNFSFDTGLSRTKALIVIERGKALRGTVMEEEKEKKSNHLKARLKDLVGLPPGDGTPHGERAKPEPDTTPEGGLTSPDGEGLNPYSGTGLEVER
jgi:hypothetical protein